MANVNRPNSNGSQFFITTARAERLDNEYVQCPNSLIFLFIDLYFSLKGRIW